MDSVFGDNLTMKKFYNSSASSDYFAHLFSDHLTSMYIFLAFAILSTMVCPLALYCVIWFERFGSDSKRTLLNMLASLGCWSLIEFIIFVEIPEILRHFIGPLNSILCFFLQTDRSRIYNDLLLQLDAMAIVRYISIFWLKNPAGINDDFWIVFINLFIKMLGAITMFAWHFLAPRQPLGYYICSGQNPIEDYKKPIKFYAVAEIFTLILQITVNLKINLFKKKVTLVEGNIRHKNQKSITSRKIDYAVNIYIFITLLNILKLTPTRPEDLHKYPNYLLLYYRSLAMPGIGAILLFSVYFIRHSSLRRLIFEKLEHSAKCSVCGFNYGSK